MAQASATDDTVRELDGHAICGVVLSAAGLVKCFGGVTAVNGISLDIHAGEVLAVIGPNGAGKSTLVNLLSGNLLPTSTLSVERTSMPSKRQGVWKDRLSRGGPQHKPGSLSLPYRGSRPFRSAPARAHRDAPLIRPPGALREERELDQLAHEVLNSLGLARFASEDAKTYHSASKRRSRLQGP